MADHILHTRISRKDRKLVDKVMMFACVVAPLFVLPQLFQIFSNHDATNVSITTWVSFALFAFIYLLYGIVHRLKPLIITNILWLIVELAAVAGILIYG
ncbi:hypothetical protein A3F37_01155 [Candidatus Saccharibacteria bacterium RIFCSPHIGHO2_12_FULL_41_12]|nr:MAG: hypothetical protein A3F37_01155 [Candidatus Saccharibacteria bacterium RIFCSPHIGHO2_12_FULL_41_12]